MTSRDREDVPVQRPSDRPPERGRGVWGMNLFIATEAMLFVFAFFAYFYLGARHPRWPPGEDPSVTFALPLLGVLLLSSVVLHWGKRGVERGRTGRLRAGLGGTLILGVAFLVLQYFEYLEHLEHLTPRSNAYGSIFYAITSLHLAHVLVGMAILGHVFARALAGHFDEERHLAVANASRYWHFVDGVWLVVVAVLYVSPHFY